MWLGRAQVTKGAPQVILNMSHNADDLRSRVQAAVQELADRGFRSLGVGISYTGVDAVPHWEFQVCACVCICVCMVLCGALCAFACLSVWNSYV